MTAPRVLFYVQYLEGVGHVVRARLIAAALAKAGADVHLVLGGPPWSDAVIDGVKVSQLPPLMAGPDSYSRLLTGDGVVAGDAVKNDRRDRLLAIADAFRPDVVMTEGYPMGRWAMDFELIPLLDLVTAWTPRPLVLASLRDILQMPKREPKWVRSVALFERYFDAMLIHGDARLVRVEESFPPIETLLDRAHYTGLVAPDAGADQGAGPADRFDVIVTGGGGAIGWPVLTAAMAAKPMSALADASWLALAGPRMADERYDELGRIAERRGVQLERFRPNLARLLASARLSIQRAGYNTTIDLLRAGCQAVLVPDADNGQMEQPTRARKLAELGVGRVVDETELTPERLATAIDEAIVMPAVTLDLNLDGAARSAAIVLELFSRQQGAQGRI